MKMKGWLKGFSYIGELKSPFFSLEEGAVVVLLGALGLQPSVAERADAGPCRGRDMLLMIDVSLANILLLPRRQPAIELPLFTILFSFVSVSPMDILTPIRPLQKDGRCRHCVRK